MKIIYDGQIFSRQKFGGISRLYTELINNLSNIEELDITLLGRFHINNYLENSDIKILSKSLFLPFMSKLPSQINGIINRSYKLYETHQCDIYHETYFDSFKASLSSNARRVVTVYDMIDEKFSDNSIRSKTIIKNKKKAVKRADHIICISESTKKDLVDIIGIDPDIASVVHLGSNLAPKHSKILYQTTHMTRDFILYVGPRSGYKNFEVLINAFANSNHIKQKFSLIAFGGGAFNKNELKLIKKSNVSAMQLSGPDELLTSLYSEAFVFVYPSKYEGFGIPPLEAMQLGCPVICSKVSSIPEVVGDAGLYFINDNPESLKECIELMLESIIRDSYIEKGYKRSRLFTWNKSANKTLQVYRKITS